MKSFYLLIILFFLPFSLQSSLLTEKLAQGKSQDYVVYQVDKWIHYLSIIDLQKNILTLEEITLPSSKKPKKSWKEWKEKKAPSHTSWNIYTIDLEKIKILSAYDLVNGHYYPSEALSSFILDLMALPLSPIPLTERKKIGQEPEPGIMDTRSLWNPPCFFLGSKLEKPRYHVYSTKWKQDQSELSGKIVDCYFLEKKTSFPFPVWIQIRDASDARFNLLEIDAGSL